jgi:hypothetical protein
MPIGVTVKKPIDKQFYCKGFNELKVKTFFRNAVSSGQPVTVDTISSSMNRTNTELLNRPAVGLSMLAEQMIAFYHLIDFYPSAILSDSSFSFIKSLQESTGDLFDQLNLNPTRIDIINGADAAVMKTAIKKLFKRVGKLGEDSIGKLSKLANFAHALFHFSFEMLRLHAMITNEDKSLEEVGGCDSLLEAFGKSFEERIEQLKNAPASKKQDIDSGF